MTCIADRYEVVKSLGRGGIGEALLVRDLWRGSRLGVLKRVGRDAFKKNLESLRREFVTLTELAHPNIARVEDFGEDKESYFFFGEYIDGEDLFSSLKEANYNQVLAVTAQILRALGYLHGVGFRHGDLKPENIRVVRGVSPLMDDAVKLIDFGLAAELAGLESGSRAPSGSLPFMAPEVLLERPTDHRVDLYGLGVCLFRVLTGRLPFETTDEESPAERIRRRLEGRPPEPRSLKTGIPRGLNDLTVRLLATAPDDRFSGASQALKFLNGIEGEQFPLWTEAEIRRGLFDGPFFDREKEIGKIRAAWGRGERRVSVVGPEGSGRTRLLTALKGQLELEGRQVSILNSLPTRPFPKDSYLLIDGESVGWPLSADCFVCETGGQAGGVEVGLKSWTEDEVAQFLKDRLRLGSIPPPWRALLVPLTQGLPQRVITLAEYLLAEKIVVIDGDRSEFRKTAPPPGLDAQAIYERRLERLDRKRKELLQLLAWTGVPLSSSLIGELARESTEALQPLLQSLEREGWLRRVLQRGTVAWSVEDARVGEVIGPSPSVGPAELIALMEDRYQAGDYRQAVRFADQLLSQGGARLTRPQEGHLFQRGAILFAETGNLDRAALCCEKLQRGLEGTAERGELHARWGKIEYHRGRYDEALKLFEKARGEWNQLGDCRQEAAATNYLGMTLSRLNLPDRAVEAHREALALIDRRDPMAAAAWMNQAMALRAAERYEEAIGAYEEAGRLAEQTANRSVQGQVLNGLANLWIFLGKLDRASTLVSSSLRTAIENGLKNLEGSCHLLLAVIADKEGDLERFRDSVDRSLVLFEGEGAVTERRNALLHKGYYEYTAGNDRAALEIVSRLGAEVGEDSPLKAQIDLLEGKVAARSKPPDIARGEGVLTHAARLLEERGDLATLWDVTVTLGRLMRREKPDEARRYYERALALLDRLAEKIPKTYRSSFFRDRKQEKIREELRSLT